MLYGILELVPFDTVDVYGWEVPRAFLSASFVLLLVSSGMWCTWRWRLFTAFDCDAAKAAGVPTVAVTVGLLVGVSLATVAGFVAVGAILVVAMLVVPAAAAERLVHRLHHALCLAVVIAVVGAVGGYLLAWRFGTSAAGMMAVYWESNIFLPSFWLPMMESLLAWFQNFSISGEYNVKINWLLFGEQKNQGRRG